MRQPKFTSFAESLTNVAVGCYLAPVVLLPWLQPIVPMALLLVAVLAAILPVFFAIRRGFEALRERSETRFTSKPSERVSEGKPAKRAFEAARQLREMAEGAR